MPIDATQVESPGWWLKRLGKKLLDERDDSLPDCNGEITPGLDTLKRYAEGRAPLPHVPGVDPAEVAAWMKDARTNWTSLVIDSPTERMGVDGFRFGAAKGGKSAKTADDDANRIWQENQMDADSDLVHYGALSQRRAFVLVEKGDDGRPVLTHETPYQVAVEYEPGNRRKIRAGLKMRRDDWTGGTVATLWTPQTNYAFTAKHASPTFYDSTATLRQWDALSLPTITDGQWTNELGAVPLVPFVNRRNRSLDGFAEHEDVLSIQNRINLSLINLIAAMKYGAFRQRYAAGLEVDEDPLTGAAIQPFQLDIRKLWTTDNPDVKFGEFAATDLVPYVRAVEAAVQDLAAISRTPPHYLIGAVVNVSGDALKAAETGLISKVRDRQRTFGDSWESVMRLAFKVTGDEDKATSFDAETLWRDPESRTISELADAAVKKASAGVPWRQRMEDMGYTPSQIDRMEIDRAADALNAAPAEDPQPASLQGKRDAKQPVDKPVIGRDDVPDAA
ncbi:phage portal protein [Streptomyces sp. ITFR-6]|uniref:phage portal protein n=1 Tax=Streptomyces sp. ITFR-6 TaxID=3075197 RepID=UPI00288B05A0|nr:phage portal protein [Streptomyces sp. ITFR-6]WNI28672.1 phage portal protein [Streptomyces sp. ITFR-6]